MKILMILIALVCVPALATAQTASTSPAASKETASITAPLPPQVGKVASVLPGD